MHGALLSVNCITQSEQTVCRAVTPRLQFVCMPATDHNNAVVLCAGAQQGPAHAPALG